MNQEATARIDLSVLFDLVDGDLDFLGNLVDLLVATLPDAMEDIRDSIEQRDCDRLRKAAHKLKGSVGNFGAHAAVELACRLETAESGNLTGVVETYTSLEEEIRRLRAALLALTKETERTQDARRPRASLPVAAPPGFSYAQI